MLKLATIFSGIGAIEQALHKMGIPYDIMFACDNGERELKMDYETIMRNTYGMNKKDIKNYIDNLYDGTGKTNYVEKSYLANYNIDYKNYFQDVRFLDGKDFTSNVDLFVGGSPCQSFSISGKRLGLSDTRGTLFYEFARLVDEIRPRVFIYENVPGMLSHDNGETWDVISSIFESLGYKWKLHKLCAMDFGIPQNRTRIFVVGFKSDLKIDPNLKIVGKKLDKTVRDFLETDVPLKYYHGEKGFKWITKPLSLKKRVSINADIARTQAANQQFNWCGDMIFEEYDADVIYDERVFIGEYNGMRGVARKLTPRECLRLMGFSDDFKIVVPDQQMYRQCGNSIVVDILEAIITAIINTGVFSDE